MNWVWLPTLKWECRISHPQKWLKSAAIARGAMTSVAEGAMILRQREGGSVGGGNNRKGGGVGWVRRDMYHERSMQQLWAILLSDLLAGPYCHNRYTVSLSIATWLNDDDTCLPSNKYPPQPMHPCFYMLFLLEDCNCWLTLSYKNSIRSEFITLQIVQGFSNYSFLKLISITSIVIVCQ